MFATIYTQESVRRRHREGPLAAERDAYLRTLLEQGHPRSVILRQASWVLAVAHELGRWPKDRRFDYLEFEGFVAAWTFRRVDEGFKGSLRNCRYSFYWAALGFLKHLKRLVPACLPAPLRVSRCFPKDLNARGPHEDEIASFMRERCDARGQSEATRKIRRTHILRFMAFLDKKSVTLKDLTADHADAFILDIASTWSRQSIASMVTSLRVWLEHCESQGWTRRGLATALIVPKIYRHEGLPTGPTWQQIGEAIPNASAKDATTLRNRAVLLLLAVYGLRSGEIRRLTLDDLDWQKNQIHIRRSKSGRAALLPLEPTVGNAIARYLQHGRQACENRSLFLTVIAPIRPITGSAINGLVSSRLLPIVGPGKGCSPRALRHASARRLVDQGFSLKAIGDHLGHRLPNTTRIYAKVDLSRLRLAAIDDLETLL